MGQPYHIRDQSFGHPPFLIYLYLQFTELFFLSEKKTKTLAVRPIFHSIHHGGTPTPTITHFFVKTQFVRTTCLKSSSFLRIDFESYWRSFIPNNFFHIVCFQIRKRVYKNYTEKWINVIWFLNIVSAAGHNIAHTKSHLLMEILSTWVLLTQKMGNLIRII